MRKSLGDINLLECGITHLDPLASQLQRFYFNATVIRSLYLTICKQTQQNIKKYRHVIPGRTALIQSKRILIRPW